MSHNLCCVVRPMMGSGSMLLTRRHVFFALLASSLAALAAAQGTGVLPAGQTLQQVTGLEAARQSSSGLRRTLAT